MTYSPADVSKDGIIVLRSSNIKNGILDYVDLVKVNKQIKASLITKKDDILICARNGSARLIGKNAILKEGDANNTFGAFMMVYRSEINPYIHHLLSTTQYTKQISENLGARINQITTSDFNSFKFYLSKDKFERDKISKFIDLLDERISTQMKIIEDLKVLKAEIVESLFSHNDQNKTYTYRDLFTISSARNKDLVRTNILSASQELGMIERDKLNLDIKFNSDSINTYKLVDDGDYIIHLRSFQGGFAFSLKSGICSPAYTILKPNNLLGYGFLRSYFTSQFFIKSLVIVTYGIRDGRSINVDEFMDLKIQLPPKAVQLKITAAIDTIMNKIEVEQSILSTYKQQKEYLLREMFI